MLWPLRCADAKFRPTATLEQVDRDLESFTSSSLTTAGHRQHHAFLVTYRPLFMRDMSCGGPYFSKLLLNAIYFSVAKFSKRPEVFDDVDDPRTAGLRFLRRVKELLGEALDKSRIPTIQALLLLSSSLFALGWQSAPWVYSGIAFRMLSDLGLNHDWRSRVVKGGEVEPADLEIRRRLVWAAFGAMASHLDRRSLGS